MRRRLRNLVSNECCSSGTPPEVCALRRKATINSGGVYMHAQSIRITVNQMTCQISSSDSPGDVMIVILIP